MYDIGKLFDKFDNIQMVKKTFRHISEQELKYRKLHQSDYLQVLADIFETACVIAFRGTDKKNSFEELNEGIKKLIHFTYSEPYRIEDAIVSAGKAAYLSGLLKNSSPGEIRRFDKKEDLTHLDITRQDFTKFNKIKKYRPEAFFYWFQAINLLEK